MQVITSILFYYTIFPYNFNNVNTNTNVDEEIVPLTGDSMPMGLGVEHNLDPDNQEASNIYRSMYIRIRKGNIFSCTRRLNGTHQFGCGG